MQKRRVGSDGKLRASSHSIQLYTQAVYITLYAKKAKLKDLNNGAICRLELGGFPVRPGQRLSNKYNPRRSKLLGGLNRSLVVAIS